MAASSSKQAVEVVSAESIAHMRAANAPTCVLGGWRKVANCSYMHVGHYQEIKTMEIPEMFSSYQTFSFMGFDNETAEKLWTEFKTKSNQDDPAASDPYTFAARYVRELPDVVDAKAAKDDWLSVIKAAGCSDFQKERLMSLEFTAHRLKMGSAKEWIVFKTHERWTFLQRFDTLVKAVADAEKEQQAQQQRANEARHNHEIRRAYETNQAREAAYYNRFTGHGGGRRNMHYGYGRI